MAQSAGVGLNPATSADYGRMRLRVMRQVSLPASNKKSIDLVLFVNGLPVATIELEAPDFTRSVQGCDQPVPRRPAAGGETAAVAWTARSRALRLVELGGLHTTSA
jgi:hypothetical protein